MTFNCDLQLFKDLQWSDIFYLVEQDPEELSTVRHSAKNTYMYFY